MSKTFKIGSCSLCHFKQFCPPDRHWTSIVKADSEEDLLKRIYDQTVHILESDGCFQVNGKKVFTYDKEKNVFILKDEFHEDIYLRVLSDFLEIVFGFPEGEIMKNIQTEWCHHEIKLGGEAHWINLEMIQYVVKTKIHIF